MELDNSLTPISKLQCIINCFKTVINILELTTFKNEAAGADDSLPCLIYAILKSKHSRLNSNMKYNYLFWIKSIVLFIFSEIKKKCIHKMVIVSYIYKERLNLLSPSVLSKWKYLKLNLKGYFFIFIYELEKFEKKK